MLTFYAVINHYISILIFLFSWTHKPFLLCEQKENSTKHVPEHRSVGPMK